MLLSGCVLAVCREDTTLVSGLGPGAASERQKDLAGTSEACWTLCCGMRYFSATRDLLNQTKCLKSG